MISHQQIFVSGKWIDSTATETIEVVNPATEETIGTVARGTAEDVDQAARAAADAFEEWSRTPREERAALIRGMARALEARADELTQTVIAELGTPMSAARTAQTGVAIAHMDNYARAMDEVEWEREIDRSSVWREPVGVVGALCAWNGPLSGITVKAGGALAAGCTVVIKSSEVAPLSSYAFADAAAEAGIPPGVVNLVSGTGPEVGEALVKHPLVDMLSLTGSVASGRRVMEVASQAVKRVSLELGGKSANVVLDGADFEAAIASGLQDAYRSTGQVCGGLSRLLVPKSRLAESEEIAVRLAEGYVIGDPLDPATTLGPVVSDVQRSRVREHISGAINDGVRLLTGGVDSPEGISRGYYVRPTIFSGVNSDRIAREEVFGPVVIIIGYEDEDEAVAIANDSVYGLAGAVWAADSSSARTVARRIRTGRIRINGEPINIRAPHGGFKLSGMGREMGTYGIEEFLDTKAVHG